MEDADLDSQDVKSILDRLDRTSPDSLLVSLARELMRVQRAVAGLEARLVSAEILQSAVDRVVSVQRALPSSDLPSEITIDAAFSLGSDWGFYPLENDERGNAYRWTGPGSDFYFELLLDREKELEFQLTFVQFFVKDPDQSLRCFVDSREVETQLVGTAGGFELRGRLPPRKGGGTVIAFTCGMVASPAETGASPDVRKLGVAFRRLHVNRAPAASREAATAAQDAVPPAPARRVRAAT